ncbi:MAG: hypothetical protein FD157_1656 [Rhodocyclaceae bacterium]|nr:MAG: hypothetical protein FD157_1656 [Rhodocyclaceae bacterium]TND00274.1 MAG: hypothetical protein FD118_3214 [Rhodocyclaceae bacterium]
MADRAGHQSRRLTSPPVLLALLLAWAGAAGAASLTAAVRTSAGAPVKDAAIILEPTGRTPPPVRARATIEQRDREFIPYLSIVRKGTSIEFPNHDPVKHHIYSFSPAKVFEIKLYAGKSVNPVVFDKTGEVVLGCNIHDWMAAHVLVVDTPWFAKTGADGLARIDGVPAGTYRLRLWHPRQKVATPDRDLSLGAAVRRIEFTVDLTPRLIVPKPPLDAGGY